MPTPPFKPNQKLPAEQLNAAFDALGIPLSQIINGTAPNAGTLNGSEAIPVSGLRQTTPSDLANYTINVQSFPDSLAPAYLKTTSDLLNAQPVSVMRFINPTAHAAIYNGTSTYDTTADVQSAAQALNENGALVFPRGNFLMGNVQWANLTNVDVIGNGSLIQLTGDGTANGGLGWQLVGNISGLDISGFVVVGDANVNENHQHKFVWSGSGQNLNEVHVFRNDISNVIVGVSFNANLGGTIEGCLVELNYIHDIYGIAPGRGYGAHLAYLNVGSAKNQVLNNWFARCQRHAVYTARASDATVQGNLCWAHRTTLTPAQQADPVDGLGRFRPAYLVARSSHILFENNYNTSGNDGSFLVTANPEQEPNTFCFDVMVHGNHFVQPLNAVPLLCVGDSQPNIAGFPEDVTISGNKLYADFSLPGSTTVDLLRNYAGKDIRYRGNHVVIKNATTTISCMEFRNAGETAGTNTYSDNITIEGNDFHVTTSNASNIRGIRVDATVLQSSAVVEIGRNPTTGTGAVDVVEAAANANPQYRKKTASDQCKGIYSAGSTTVDVSRGITALTLTNASATSITNFTNGEDGQVINLRFSDANTTLVNSTSLHLAGAVNFVSSNLDTLVLRNDSGAWYEQSRSLN